MDLSQQDTAVVSAMEVVLVGQAKEGQIGLSSRIYSLRGHILTIRNVPFALSIVPHEPIIRQLWGIEGRGEMKWFVCYDLCVPSLLWDCRCY